MREFVSLIQLMVNHPSHVFGVVMGVSGAIALWTLLAVWKRAWRTGLDKIAEIQTNVANHSSDVRTDFKNLSIEVNQSVKALQNDLIRHRETILSNKEDLVFRMQSLTDFFSKLDLECIKVARELKMTADEFSAKFGRLLEMRSEVKETIARVIALDKTAEKHHEQLAKVATLLEAHKEEIERLKGKK